MTKENGAVPADIREIVLGVLMEVLENNRFSSGTIHAALEKYQYLDKQERAFLTRLSEGTMERLIELDYILNHFSKVKVHKMKPVIRNILRMGVYQIKYMKQIPDSAACNEAVKLAGKKGFHNLKGFVNGVLRTVSRSLTEVIYPEKEKEPVKYLSILFSVPEWIVELWLKMYNYNVVEKILVASLQETDITVRCNLSRITVEDLKDRLCKEGLSVADGRYLPYAIHISDYNYINKIPSFSEGYFQIQDESSMLVAEVAGIKENDYVIDVCAAPGGKSLHVADKLKHTGMVSARDISEFKVSLIDENIERTGYKNIRTKVMNALEVDEDSIGAADVVIADLPCSGLGVIGKKSDIKYKMTQEICEELAELQRKILRNAQSYVKPGGILIFSTCTIHNGENIENIKWFEEQFTFRLESMDEYLPDELKQETTGKGYLQLLPGVHETDGFFLARFRKERY